MMLLQAPSHPIRTQIRLSGSKSLSNRLLILKELLNSDLNLRNISDSDDTLLLIKALEQINDASERSIDIGDAGSDMRFLTAFLSVRDGAWTIGGSTRMKERPIGILVKALQLIGAEIRYVEKEGFPPLNITGQALKGGRVEVDGSTSSQFISALLLIAPALNNGLEIELKGDVVSRPYIGMTVELLKRCGISIEAGTNTIRVWPMNDNATVPGEVDIESDWSSASYWYSICALSPGSQIELSLLRQNSLQADAVLPQLYQALGVESSFQNDSVILKHSPARVTEFVHDFSSSPDIAQTVAVTCAAMGIPARLSGLQTLKIKETDRIAALKTELDLLGLVTETSDSVLAISANPHFPKGDFRPQQSISTYGDHRMAMSFAPLALRCSSLSIKDPGVVNKSYRHFWEDLKSAGFNVNLQP